MEKAKANFFPHFAVPLSLQHAKIIIILMCFCCGLHMCYSSQRVRGHLVSVRGWKESVSPASLDTYLKKSNCSHTHCVSGTGDSLLWLVDYTERSSVILG